MDKLPHCKSVCYTKFHKHTQILQYLQETKFRLYADSILHFYFPMVFGGDIPAISEKKINLISYIRIMIFPLKDMNLSFDLPYLVC